MKIVIGLMAFLTTLSAHAILRVHFGKLSYADGRYYCTYENPGHGKFMKWVYFGLQPYTGEGGMDEPLQLKVDEIVPSGGSITADSGDHVSPYYNVVTCRFFEDPNKSPGDEPMPTVGED